MYDVSDSWKEKVLLDGTIHTLFISINGEEVETNYILGCKVEHQLFSSDEFELGTTEARTCEIKLYKDAITKATRRRLYNSVRS